MTDSPSRPLRSAIVTIALLSASLLAFQVLLTRVCALRLHFHFGFLIISNSLLGIGASGSLLALVEKRWRRAPDAWIRAFGLLYLLSLPLCWTWLLTAQVPVTLTFDKPDQVPHEVVQLALFNLACAVPFFFGGTAVGLILSANAAQVHRVYAADLLGAGLGCLLCPTLLWHVGAGGCFLTTVLLGALAVACSPASGLLSRLSMGALAVAALAGMPFLDVAFPVPGKIYLDITQAHTLTMYGRPLFTQWSANSRIDVLPLPASYGTFLQTRGAKAKAMPLPEQWWISQDGDAGTMLTDFGKEPDKLPVLADSMYSASFRLKQGPKARVCVIGVGGAPDLWAAKIHDCARILGIELNRAIVDVHHGVAKEWSKPLLADPRVEVRVDEGRSALMRTDERFDVVQLTGIDTWTALNSGAYVLAENYLYTVEACRAMYERLEEGGILQITRMAAGMETIRLLNNMRTSLPAERRGSFAQSVAALHTDDGLIAVLLKKGPYTPAEVERLADWSAAAGIEAILLPGRALTHKDPNSSAIQQFAQSDHPDEIVASYPFDVSPTTDDRPYFFSFLRWNDPEKAREYLHKATSVVQGNPLFLRYQLLGSALAAALFIVLPLVFRRGATGSSRRGALRFLVYFACLGLGFIGIEVALIQKFTLLLGQPLYSIVVTLFAILVSTGVGAACSGRFLGDPRRARRLPLAILLLVALVAYGSPLLVQGCIGWPLWARATVVAAAIAPIGFLLGMPFAHGIKVVERTNPSFVPWAWAVNGSTTVIGSISTVILSMNFGFAAVLVGSAAVYLIAFAALAGSERAPAPAPDAAEVAEPPVLV
jgi:hypothetical protein